MMHFDHAEFLFKFHQWRKLQLIEVIDRLPVEVLEKDIEGSFSSLKEIIRHLIWAESVWMSRLENGEMPKKGSTSQEWESMKEEWKRITDKWVAWIHSATDADFNSEIAFKDSSGNSFGNTLFEIIIHLIDHATYHVGQVMNTVRTLGYTPISTNVIHYLRDLKAKAI